jgi:hypothetical protein
MNRNAGAAILILISARSAGAAETAPAGLAPRTAAALHDALPEDQVTIADPMTLKVRIGDGSEFTVALDGLSRTCAGDQAGCANTIKDFAGKIALTIRGHDAPRGAAQLRAVVRDKAYADFLNDTMKKAKTPSAMVYRPLAGDLVEICYFDTESAMSLASDVDIAKLGLDRDAALTLCEKNVHAALPNLATVAKLSKSDVGVLSGDAYESSYVLFHDDWGPVAARLRHPLLVVVPQADVVVFAEETGPEVAQSLSQTSQDAMATAQRPISSQVLRWTQQGWQVAAP